MANPKLILIAVCSTLGVICACSHFSPPPEDRVVMDKSDPLRIKAEFDGKCAMSVANGDFSKVGNLNYRTEYEGKTFLFATADAKSKFDQDIQKNAEMANRHWHEFEQREEPGRTWRSG